MELFPLPLGPTITVIGNSKAILAPGARPLKFGKVASPMKFSNGRPGRNEANFLSRSGISTEIAILWF
jgi:hypothetical protein